MSFTEHELYLLSEGIIKLIRDASTAHDLVSDTEAQKYIRIHIDELQTLNTKICKYAERQEG